MTAQSKVEGAPLNAYRRLNQARGAFHATKLTKTGKNTFAGYSYFELGDFLIPALAIFDQVGLSGVISFSATYATMHIVNVDDPTDRIIIESPMGSAALKGCHEVQNIGAVETYQRRYLWATALEIVEHDALDATTGNPAARGIKQGERDEPPAAMPEHEWGKLVQLVEASGANVAAMLKFLKIEVPGNNLQLLNQDQYGRVLEALNTKLAAKIKAETDAKAREDA